MNQTSLNNKWHILKFIGILLVVGGHCGVNFSTVFPAYSFHMPLFFFIAGYFFKGDMPFKDFVWKKFKRLIVPLWGWSVFYAVFVQLVHHYGIKYGASHVSLYNLFVETLTFCGVWLYNAPAWFLGTLFVSLIAYYLVNKIFVNLKWGGVFCLVLALMGLYVAYHNAWNHWCWGFSRLLARSAYALFFVWLGCVYKKYEHLDRFSLFRIACVGTVNLFLLAKYSRYGISSIMHWMNADAFRQHSYWLPFVVAITGICFYLQIVELLKDKLADNKFVNYVSNNTLSIMMHHLTAFFLLNTLLMFLNNNGLLRVPGWNQGQFYATVGYKVGGWKPVMAYVYMVIGVLLPLGGCWICDRIRQMVMVKIKARIEE